MQGGRRIQRYVLGPEIASGGMASVHLARMLRGTGFGKTVAVKRLHAQYGRDPEAASLFLDEARVTSGLSHPNIVMTLDVLEEQDELYLVMEYVHGASFSQIMRATDGGRLPARVGAGIVAAMLDGLHSAHVATDETGAPLHIIHRDVSPQNVLVTFHGVAKIADFGIARAAGRAHSTADGSVKGKVGYMAPEVLLGDELTPRTDIYSAGVVLWEALTGRRLIDFGSTAENLRAVLEMEIPRPSTLNPEVLPEVDEVVKRALARAPADRFATAKEMAIALRRAVDVANAAEIGDWLCAERPHLREGRDALLADLQRALDAPSRGSRPSLSFEIEPDTNAFEEGSGDLVTPAPVRVRWIYPVLTLVFAICMAGVTLVLARRPPSALPATAAPPPAASPAVVASDRQEMAPPPVVATIAPPPPSAAPAPSAIAAPSAKPRPSAAAAASAASSARRKCRIVPTTDNLGHTQFAEVCP